jgi:hypothetical protein
MLALGPDPSGGGGPLAPGFGLRRSRRAVLSRGPEIQVRLGLDGGIGAAGGHGEHCGGRHGPQASPPPWARRSYYELCPSSHCSILRARRTLDSPGCPGGHPSVEALPTHHIFDNRY